MLHKRYADLGGPVGVRGNVCEAGDPFTMQLVITEQKNDEGVSAPCLVKWIWFREK